MERESQSAHSGVIARVAPVIHKTNFYRFCQLVENANAGAAPLGSTSSPADDPLRFRPHPGMGFPSSEMKRVEWGETPDQLPSVRTTFLGLYGVDSPLPTRYLDDIAQRREGHQAIEGFLDIFNHRMLTQFYRIWRKYSYPASYEAGGSDATSQCLLGLIGLGIPGSARKIATPMSRFLALLSTMRLPTRTAEGVQSLVTLLAPHTRARVIAHWPQSVPLAQPASFNPQRRTLLSQRQVLGKVGVDANSQLLLKLYTADAEEARGWQPGGQLHSDLLVLLRVYLGWRCSAKLQLTLPHSVLPDARLQRHHVQLGRSAILGFSAKRKPASLPDNITINLDVYQGLTPNPVQREAIDGGYQF
ncbi:MULTISPECIES: type VI secretion system baseplate subunit TssG [Pantoea]|uniref:Type VI secretion protein n=2 Tax=Pantoea TaxID=53335 RepID=A0A0U3UKT8_9GAMM|nr:MULTISPECIES: type VI secretion system baseplate subunit TssG [Pantoea]ALV94418.1 type VI secretion protein [Pantoea vagans]KHJ68915.1 type VI secretion protein [Pantoea rodasii]